MKDKKRLQKAINSVFVQNTLKSVLYGDQSEGCIIEEYIDGKEYSVDIIWNNSVAVDTIICSRIQNDLVHCLDYLYFIDPKIDKVRKKNAIVVCDLISGLLMLIVSFLVYTESSP